MLNYIFNVKDLPTITTNYKYSRGYKYTKAALKIILVVDQIPLVIAVLFRIDIKRKEGRFQKVFKEIEIQYDTIKGIYIICYKPIGYVFYISKIYYTAYQVGRGLNKGKIVYYNNMAGGNIVYYKINNQQENIKVTQGIIAVFYK